MWKLLQTRKAGVIMDVWPERSPLPHGERCCDLRRAYERERKKIKAKAIDSNTTTLDEKVAEQEVSMLTKLPLFRRWETSLLCQKQIQHNLDT